MPVITIRGQTGSGASDIGRQVARLIGGEYVDRQVISEVATLLKIPAEQIEEKERAQPHIFQRIIRILRRTISRPGRIEDSSTKEWEDTLDDDEYLNALQAVIRDLALEENMVLVGRGSQFILRNNRSVLHVLIVAPLEDRLNKTMIDLNIDHDEALRYIEEGDSRRRVFIQKFFQKDVEDPQYYDLVINTRYISYDAAARLIVSTANEKNPWK